VGHGRPGLVRSGLPRAGPPIRSRTASRAGSPFSRRFPRRAAGDCQPATGSHHGVRLAATRTNGPVLELARHPVTIALIVLAVVGGTVAAVALRPPRPAPALVKHAYPIPARDHRIVVEVLNTTPRSGLARSATRALRRQGVDVVFFGNADGASALDSTQVVARRGDRGVATTVARALGQGTVKIQADTLRRVDVTVLLGGDYRAPDDGHP
jgi:hypothetical protein